MSEFVPDICTGLFSGFLASFLFLVWMLAVKPRLRVSNNINIKSKKENIYTYQVKIVNLSRTTLANVTYRLFHCSLDENGNLITFQEIMPNELPLTIISKYKRNSKYSEYAVRVSFDVDNDKYRINKTSYLKFSISAEHSISNTLKTVTKDYRAGNVKQGKFETGKSLKII